MRFLRNKHWEVAQPVDFIVPEEQDGKLRVNCTPIETRKEVDLAFVEFRSDEYPKYAILSHTWGDEEVTYQDISTGSGKEKAGYQKIASLAQKLMGKNEFFWVDTCCIDKTNTAELSEAINSMYKWYANADVCYVYLSDVTFNIDRSGNWDRRNGIERENDLMIRSSRWFTRGWTLQELLAPRESYFFDSTWRRIGDKYQLRHTISGATGIDVVLLEKAPIAPGCDVREQSREPVNSSRSSFHSGPSDRSFVDRQELSGYSVAQKMSWAAGRETTRPEDMAYCLMGIFGVNMPLIYGEGGPNAFFRLQQEIIKTTTDQSIFTWLPAFEVSQTIGMFASSPREFKEFGRIVPRRGSQHRAIPFVATNLGLRIRLPVYWSRKKKCYVVALDCYDLDLAQPVCIHVQPSNNMGKDVFFRLPGIHLDIWPRRQPCRLLRQLQRKWQMREVYIR